MADVTRSAGWYPDPDGAAGERWWNGAGWSDSRRGGAAAAASTPYAPERSVMPPPPAAGAVPLPTTPAVPLPPSVIYSADNPAPQRPDPYAQSNPYAPPAFTRPDPYSQPPAPAPVRISGIDVRANRNAMIGFVLGVVSIFVNVLFVAAPLAIVFSALGVVKARQLAAQGVRSTLMPFAIAGLVTGVIATIIGIISIVSIIVGISVDVSNT